MLAYRSLALIAVVLLFVAVARASAATGKLKNELPEDESDGLSDDDLDGGFESLNKWYAHDFQEKGTPDYNSPRKSPCAKAKSASACATCCEEQGMAGSFRTERGIKKRCSCAARHSNKTHPL